jgi:hypothetical protein
MVMEEGGLKMKRLIAACSGLSIVVLAAGLLATAVVAQEAGNQSGATQDASAQGAKKHKEARWEGFVTRSDREKKMLTVREVNSGIERNIAYDDSTQWTSQEHGSKKVNVIDPTQIKDHDRVICLGTYDKKKVLHATLISKRLTHGND